MVHTTTFHGATLRHTAADPANLDISPGYWIMEVPGGPSVAVNPLPAHGQWSVTINTEDQGELHPETHNEGIPYLAVYVNDATLMDVEPGKPAPAAVTLIPADIMLAMRTVVEYDWATEQESYEHAASDGDDTEGHVFNHLRRLDEWLKAQRLEELRVEIRAERISYGELAELQSLSGHIAEGDVELLEWAGVPEHPEDEGEDA